MYKCADPLLSRRTALDMSFLVFWLARGWGAEGVVPVLPAI